MVVWPSPLFNRELAEIETARRCGHRVTPQVWFRMKGLIFALLSTICATRPLNFFRFADRRDQILG